MKEHVTEPNPTGTPEDDVIIVITESKARRVISYLFKLFRRGV